MSRLSPEKALASKKIRYTLAGLIVLCVLLAGGLFYLHYRSTTISYAVDKLNEALAKNDIDRAVQMVDFYILSEKLADAIAVALPESEQGERNKLQKDIEGKIRGLFEENDDEDEQGSRSASSEASVSPAPLDDEVFDILRRPTHVLPPDLREQIAANPFRLQAEDGQVAIITTTVTHPQLKTSFPIRLSMQKHSNGWRVSEVSNAGKLVGDFMGRVKELTDEAMHAFEAENARLRSLISTYYHVDECKAAFFPPDADDVVRVRITLQGRNLGERALVSSAAMCHLFDRAGNEVGVLRLENMRRVAAGETFEHSWLFTFENLYPEVERMVEAGEMTCRAAASTASLGKGVFLYQRNVKDFPGVRYE